MASMEMHPVRALLGAMLLLAGSVAAGTAMAQQVGIRRTELQRHDLSAPVREAVQVRVDIDPGHAFGRHTHPGEEIIYVLEGSLVCEIYVRKR